MKRSLAFVVLLSACGMALQGASVLLTISSLPGRDATGTPVGFMPASIPGEDPLQVLCDDYLSTSYIPNTIQVNVSGIPDLAFVRFAGGSEMYKRAALLMEDALNKPTEISAYQWAIWALFTPSLDVSGISGAQAKLDWSAGAVLDRHDYSGVRIFTPTTLGVNGYNDAQGRPNASNQEFLSFSPAPEVPEPASLVLVGGALLLAGLVRRGRRA